MQAIAIRKILVALGHSPVGLGPLPAAIALAQRLPNAELVLFQAWGYTSPFVRWLGFESRRAGPSSRAEAVEGLEVRAKEVPPHISVSVVARHGAPWEEICAAAKKHRADIVVVGSHEPWGTDHLQHTTAERVALGAGVPVLTVPHEAAARSTSAGGTPLSRILVPVDFSPLSIIALEYASRLAQGLGASVDVLHAWSSPTLWGIGLGGLVVRTSVGKRSLRDLARDRAEADLDRAMTGMRAHAAPRLLEGDASSAILEYAPDFDLVVLGTRRGPRSTGLVDRGITSRIVRRSRCPVLTVPHEQGIRLVAAPNAGARGVRASENGAP
jgi:universal stress protein A